MCLDYSISQQISHDFNHNHICRKLDDLSWLNDYKRVLFESNWSTSFLVGAQKYSLFKNLDYHKNGIIHTGLLGDAVISTFYASEE